MTSARPDVIECRSCRELITFKRSELTGRLVPITFATGVSHFVTCPDAKAWSTRPPTRAERGAPPRVPKRTPAAKAVSPQLELSL